jgi:hypothetical protein
MIPVSRFVRNRRSRCGFELANRETLAGSRPSETTLPIRRAKLDETAMAAYLISTSRRRSGGCRSRVPTPPKHWTNPKTDALRVSKGSNRDRWAKSTERPLLRSDDPKQTDCFRPTSDVRLRAFQRPLVPSCRSRFGETGRVSKVHPPSGVVRIKPSKRGDRDQAVDCGAF